MYNFNKDGMNYLHSGSNSLSFTPSVLRYEVISERKKLITINNFLVQSSVKALYTPLKTSFFPYRPECIYILRKVENLDTLTLSNVRYIHNLIFSIKVGES